MRFHPRLVVLAAVPLALAALLGPAAPASADGLSSLSQNTVSTNCLVTNALRGNALAATGSPLADLDGVAVEAVVLADAAR